MTSPSTTGSDAAAGPGEPRVRRAAALARLSLTGEEERALEQDFGRILDAFRALASFDVADVEPLTGPLPLADVRRADVPGTPFATESLLAAAPLREGEYFAVPKTIANEG